MKLSISNVSHMGAIQNKNNVATALTFGDGSDGLTKIVISHRSAETTWHDLINWVLSHRRGSPRTENTLKSEKTVIQVELGEV